MLTYLSGLRTSREKYGYFRLNFKLTFANKNDNKYFNILHVYSGLYIGVKKEPNTITDNDNLKIAFIQIQLTHNHKKGNNGSWVKIGTIPQKFNPKQGFKVPNTPKTTVYFKTNGEILCRTDVDKDVSYTILAGGVFFYN